MSFLPLFGAQIDLTRAIKFIIQCIWKFFATLSSSDIFISINGGTSLRSNLALILCSAVVFSSIVSLFGRFIKGS